MTFEKVKGDFDYINNITRDLIAKHQDIISRIRSIVNKSTGEVLIADAKHVGPNGEGFHKAKNKPGKHNHYGKDKLGNGYFAKDRGYYSGPGH